MVRVGGGWDTLEHYLDKHDPCRCASLCECPPHPKPPPTHPYLGFFPLSFLHVGLFSLGAGCAGH